MAQPNPELRDPQQALADVRGELHECTDERDAAQAPELATAEVLRMINGSGGHVTPVFEAILEKALTLCEAAFGFLTVYDGERFELAAQRSVPEALAAYFATGIDQPRPGDAHWRLLRGEKRVHNLDQKDEDAYRSGNPLRRAVVDLGGARSTLVVALSREADVRGTLTIYRKEVRAFSVQQVALLQHFAAQAVIAMENSRLLHELRARTEEIAGWNLELEARVAAQLAELERTRKLQCFLAPQLAELIISKGDESILESHRREIVVVFCDLRGFTAFAERAEPEEVMTLLSDYQAALGPIIARFEGTIDHYAGDGIIMFFNDPLPTPEPTKPIRSLFTTYSRSRDQMPSNSACSRPIRTRSKPPTSSCLANPRWRKPPFDSVSWTAAETASSLAGLSPAHEEVGYDRVFCCPGHDQGRSPVPEVPRGRRTIHCKFWREGRRERREGGGTRRRA
jgi:class 3 adenylate cyclase